MNLSYFSQLRAQEHPLEQFSFPQFCDEALFSASVPYPFDAVSSGRILFSLLLDGAQLCCAAGPELRLSKRSRCFARSFGLVCVDSSAGGDGVCLDFSKYFDST